MRKIIVNKIMAIIRKDIVENTKIQEIRYGIETLYITITKTIVIFLISYLLGNLKELFLLTMFYGSLRLFGFGLHAKNSFQCWLISLSTFSVLPYFIKIINLPDFAKFMFLILTTVYIFIYSPADTEKRPLVKRKQRITFKILCTSISIVLFIICLNSNNNVIQNSIMIASVLECIMISPISYKLLNLKYSNYKNYDFN